MIGWLIAAGYIAGWWFTSVAAARQHATRVPHCHGECSSGYRWGYDAGACKRYCREGCWRVDGVPEFRTVAVAGAASLAWPLVLAVGLVYLSTQRAPQRALVDDKYIARLERELGIGGDR